MKRVASARTAILLVLAMGLSVGAGGRFDQKLAAEKQIPHALSRLTFGARPGAAAEVSRIGLDAWIDLQLHPERSVENPALAAKVAPLESLNLAPWQIAEKYILPQSMSARPLPSPQSLLTPAQLTMLTTGSVPERLATLDSLTPDVRRQVLAVAPDRIMDGMPQNIRQESARARQAEQEARQKEMRRQAPPLNELLAPDQQRIARNGSNADKLALLESLDPETRRHVIRAVGPQAFIGLPELRRQSMALSQPQQLVNSELIENKLYRAIHSNRQLEEVLVDFWMNHFNVYNGKGQTRVLLTSYERDAIRPHVFGRFRDMLLATARHPAMLIYLDNAQSQAPRDDQTLANASGAATRRPGLNENYGRELMELHTLGVDGGYTQEDVIAVARAFTGWTVYDAAKYAEFQFNPNTHDRKEKIILGHTLAPGRGEQDGLDVIDLLARHPSTARFISWKLAQRFVADDPPQSLVDRMAATFTKTDGDLRAVLQTLFSSTEFWSEGAWQAKLKSPLELVVSAVRALDSDAVDTFALAQRIADLGEPLYGKVEPTGYPNTGEGWASAAGLMGRINFATALTSGQIPGVRFDISQFNFKPPAIVARELLGGSLSSATLEAIEKGIEGREATPSMLTAAVLGSPEFQRR
ncbi:MAG TPA: DUF1800 domain-containing protein [Terriglobia bacterium]|nr:DUF1800 domain-containing protein [Terriglobia bacterium]